MRFNPKQRQALPRSAARARLLACALLGVHSHGWADTVPAGPGGSLVTLPGANYTLRMTDGFASGSYTGKWHTRLSSAAAIDQSRCVAEASVDDGAAVAIDANGHLRLKSWTISSSSADAVKHPAGTSPGSGKHREHRGGGLISNTTLGYGFYEVWTKPYLATKGVHTAFWTYGIDGVGQGVIEIDGLEIDSGDGAFRTAAAPNPAGIAKSTKNLYVWLGNPELDLPPYVSAAHLPWPARGNIEVKLPADGWIRSGFDYGPAGIRFFENGVEVSHTEYPAALRQIIARHPVILSAKSGLGMYASLPDLGTQAATSAITLFRDFKFYAADYLDVNLLPNGDFEYKFNYTRPNTSTTTYALDASGKVIYDAATNSCLKNPAPATVTAGGSYPIQWTLARYDTGVGGADNSRSQATVVEEASAANAGNRVLRIAGIGPADLPNVVMSQKHTHINHGSYYLRGRVKRPAGYEEARIKVSYSTGTGSTGTTYIALPSYPTAAGTVPSYAEIAPTWINVGDAGEDTFVQIEVIAKAVTQSPTGPDDTVASNIYGQKLEMLLDDLQLYKRSSVVAMPARTSDLPGHDYADKLVFSNYSSSGAHYYPSTVAAADGSDIGSRSLAYHLWDRPIGGVAETPGDLSVSMDVYSEKSQNAPVGVRMNALGTSAKRGFAMGLQSAAGGASKPFCAIGNLATASASHQVLSGTSSIAAYAGAGGKTGAKLTCTYRRIGGGTEVSLYLNGIREAQASYAGYYHDYPTAQATVGQYGHTAKLFAAAGDITYSNGQPVTLAGVAQANFVGYLGDIKVWHRLLSASEVTGLGSAPTLY